MSAMWGMVVRNFIGILGKSSIKATLNVGGGRSQVHTQSTQTTIIQGWTNWKMLRDFQRRNIVRENAQLRRRLNCLRKNRVLPRALQEIADQEIHSLPRNTIRHRIVNRCAVTSRARGNVRRWRISRIIFRHLADYNYLSGCMRGMW